MQKKLFTIRDKNDSQTLPLFFSDKTVAKTKRDELNTDLEVPRYVVTYGPDHRKTNGR